MIHSDSASPCNWHLKGRFSSRVCPILSVGDVESPPSHFERICIFLASPHLVLKVFSQSAVVSYEPWRDFKVVFIQPDGDLRLLPIEVPKHLFCLVGRGRVVPITFNYCIEILFLNSLINSLSGLPQMLSPLPSYPVGLLLHTSERPDCLWPHIRVTLLFSPNWGTQYLDDCFTTSVNCYCLASSTSYNDKMTYLLTALNYAKKIYENLPNKCFVSS